MLENLLQTTTGDANLDKKVDITDLSFLATNWQGPGGWDKGDFNGSADIGIADLSILATNFGFDNSGGDTSAQAIPEPTSIGMFLISLVASGLLIRKRKIS